MPFFVELLMVIFEILI